MEKDLVTRWHEAIEKIGGALAILALPDEVKDILSSCNDLGIKVQMLEHIAENKKNW